MKAIPIIGAATVASAFVAGACVVAWNPKCPDLPGGFGCPDNSGHTVSTCTSDGTKKSNNDVGSSSGYDPVASSGTCNYTCYWTNSLGNTVNCGPYTQHWNDTAPGLTKCPHGSGSGS